MQLEIFSPISKTTLSVRTASKFSKEHQVAPLLLPTKIHEKRLPFSYGEIPCSMTCF